MANTEEISGTSAVYARYSSHSQNDCSIEQQVRECEKFADQQGLRIVEVYADRAISGTTDKRPEFQRMLAESRSGKWSTLIVWKLDRFARNRYDSATYKYLLKKNGVRILYVKESIPDGPSGILMESLLEAQAEYYSANLAQNVKRGLVANIEQGKVNWSPPYGYIIGEDGKPAVDEEKAPIVREIFRRYADGEGTAAITLWLNTSGIQPVRASRWRTTTVHSLLKREAYRGACSCKGGQIEYPPIVDAATLEMVTERLSWIQERRAPRTRNAPYILTGKSFCGICGGKLIGRSFKGTRFVYNCNVKYPDCGAPYIPAEWLEDTVVHATVEFLLDPKVIDLLADRIAFLESRMETSEVLEGLRHQLSQAESALANVMAAVEAGIVTRTTKARLTELESEVDRLTANIREEEAKAPHLEKDMIVYWLSRFQGGDVDDLTFRETLVSTLIQSVTVSLDLVRIVFNYGTDPPAQLLNGTMAGPYVLKQQGGTTLCMDGTALTLDMDVHINPRGKRKGALSPE